MDASRVQPIKLARVTRVLGRTGSQGQCTQQTMEKCTEKRKHTEDVECSRRDSDFSDEDLSEAESFASDAEDSFLDCEESALYEASGGLGPAWETSSAFEEVCDEKTNVLLEPSEEPVSDVKPEPEVSPAKISRMEKSGKSRRVGKASTPKCKTAANAAERWCGVEEPDITPAQPIFCPARTPGSQLITTLKYTPLQLFQQFFTSTVLLNLLNNTNEFGRANRNPPSTPWKDATIEELFCFLSIVVYMGFIKAPCLTDYWRKGSLYSFPFPQKVMTGKRFLHLLRSIHLCSAKDDTKNEAKKGTMEFDRLSKIKPLYTEMRDACRRNYQPHQHISIDERMVASKARVLFKQYTKNKPVKWGFKLFVLADSITGYTWDFFVYEGKANDSTGKGLGYDSVMKLVKTKLLGKGYKLYVDNFYTSPTLFHDLLKQKIWACGTIRTHLVDFPKTQNNALKPKSPRGSIRWIRQDSLLFVQWRDTRDVSLCSTMHTAHGPDTIQRKMRDSEGKWTANEVPVPPAVKDYNKNMGGVDLSDALINYYDVLHKTKKWYKTFFYHFVDIAIVNSYILYKCQCKDKGEVPVPQKAFRESLVLELYQAGSQKPEQEAPRSQTHRLVHIGDDKTACRRRCRKCQAKTPVKCSTCDVPLCFVPNRDCYNEWHRDK